MLTNLLENGTVWLPVIAGVLLLGGYLLGALFLFTLSEALGKVALHNRRMPPGKVWLNLIPVFNLAWIYVTVSRVGDSIVGEMTERDPEYAGDGGKTLGYAFATAAALTAFPGINLVTFLPAIVLGVLYWAKMARASKALDVTGEGVFWEKYNSRLEFPNSLASATLLVTSMFFVLIATGIVWGEKARPAVPIRLVDGGDDDEGVGSPGSGQEVPVLGQKEPTKADYQKVIDKPLPEITDKLKQDIALDDPLAASTLPEEKAAAYQTVSEEIRNKLLNIGAKRGAGGSTGSGDTGQPGSGPGGIGADSTRARSLRWVLRFKTTSGRDYLNQLKALNAVVVVPIGSDKSSAYVFKPHELDNPKPGNLVTEAEWKALAQQIQFCDFKRDSATAVGEALGLNFTPAAFWAFFPQELEKELAKKEVAYRNRRPEDVAETVFQVTVREGKYELFVIEQKVKR